uniref:Uncharacterized protein n=1 Tax=Arundo donax TaxID=35708 RepID=A0A0A9EJQ8_ARUDO
MCWQSISLKDPMRWKLYPLSCLYPKRLNIFAGSHFFEALHPRATGGC